MLSETPKEEVEPATAGWSGQKHSKQRELQEPQLRVEKGLAGPRDGKKAGPE